MAFNVGTGQFPPIGIAYLLLSLYFLLSHDTR